ncbi:MAG: oligosaccharyl transferase, archaeosortase A system-associated [Archaeoglobaceae archaeon]
MRYRRYLELAVVAVAFAVAAKLRILNPWNGVFSYTVVLGGNDPWYYYRLVENLLHNFPNRIWFDPFTNYPFGTYTHFGPFLTYLSAFAAILANASGGEELRRVLAFIPAIGGILTLIPVYFLTKIVFGRRTAAIATLFLAISPGQFLQRSLLGFNDHHVWEVFWMLTLIAAMLKALEKERSAYWLLPGVAYGMFLLTWAPSFAYSILIFAFLFFAVLLKGEIERKYYEVSLLTLLIAAIVYLPFAFRTPHFSTTHYSPLQLVFLLAVTALVGLLYLFDRHYERLKLPVEKRVALVFIAILAFFVVALGTPAVYTSMLHVIGVLQPKGGALTIAEVAPTFFTQSGEFTLAKAVVLISPLFLLAVPGMLYSVYQTLRKKDVSQLLVLIWGFAMLVAVAGQNRFCYYFAAFTAIYSALLMDLILEKLHAYRLLEGNFSRARVALAVILLIAAIYPTYVLAEEASSHSGGMPKQWYDALVWLKNNSPDGNYDEYYLQLYEPSPNLSQPYPYPFETYGVMSWWDYGHWIEAVAHRMPNANPFQQGIGSFEGKPGAAPFFVTDDESYAEKIAEELRVKYVVSDVQMATGKFHAMATWAEGSLGKAGEYYGYYIYFDGQRVGLTRDPFLAPPNSLVVPLNLPSEKYCATMEAKLHMMDASGLSHYRLIYESPPPGDARLYAGNESEIVVGAIYVSYQAGVNTVYLYATQEVLYKTACKLLGFNVSIQPSGFVKIFERVKGAVVTGKASGETVKAYTVVRTNQNRTFVYEIEAKVENGEYRLTLPYAQETRYPVKAIEPYRIVSGNVTKLLTLSDADVEGRVIELDLI